MAIITDRCPYCYRPINDPEDPNSFPSIWSDDPILIENGTKYEMVDKGGGVFRREETDGRKYVGFHHPIRSHIRELQDARKAEEIGLFPFITVEDRTEFTDLPEIEDNEFFLPTRSHIQELRDSIALILEKRQNGWGGYFNYAGRFWQDTRKGEWTDPILLTYKGSIKNIHIEDLRHETSSVSFIMEDNVTNTETITPDNSIITGITYWANSGTWENDVIWDEDDELWYWSLFYHKRDHYIYKNLFHQENIHEYDVRELDQTINEGEVTFSLAIEVPDKDLPTLVKWAKSQEQNHTIFTDFTFEKTDIYGYEQKTDYYSSPTYPSFSTDGSLYSSTGWTALTPYWIYGSFVQTEYDQYTTYYGYRWGIASLP